MYTFSGVSPAKNRESLTHLSFFIAHSLVARHPENGEYSGAKIEVSEAVPGPQREDGGGMGGQRDKGQSHLRLDSEGRDVGRKGLGFSLKAMVFPMADRFGCIGGTYFLSAAYTGSNPLLRNDTRTP